MTVALAALMCAGVVSAQKPSVLLINVDDWNDWNGVLRGHPQAITPNLNHETHQKQLVRLSRATVQCLVGVVPQSRITRVRVLNAGIEVEGQPSRD